MKQMLSIASTLLLGSALALGACGKDKKPAAADPAAADPAKAEPAAAEPAKAEPAAAEPAKAEPAAADKGGGGGW